MSELKRTPEHKIRVGLTWKGSHNFQSTGIDISLEVVGDPGDTPTQTFDKAFAFVEKKMTEKVREALEDLNPSGK